MQLPPPPLTAINRTATLVRLVLVEDGIPVPPIGAYGVVMPQDIAGEALPQGQIQTQPYIAEHPTNPFSLYVIVHEELHETIGGCAGDDSNPGIWAALTDSQRQACEQAVDAVAKDEMQSVYHFFGTRILGSSEYYVRNWGYPAPTVREQVWSAKVCGCSWKSTQAMMIRRRWLFTNPTLRSPIL